MQELIHLEDEIRKIKEELLALTDMRPGSLTRQYHDRQNKKGGFWSLSYTYKMKGRTEYVRPEHVREIRRQITQFKKFKTLTARWVDLALELCRRKREMEKSQTPL